MGRKAVTKLVKKAPKVVFEAATGNKFNEGKKQRVKGKKNKKDSSYVVDGNAIKLMRRQLADVGCKLHIVEFVSATLRRRALGDQLFGDQHEHEDVRKRVVDYLEQHRDDFEPFMEDEEKFEKYCERMREDGTWGGNQELYAAARLFQIYVVVHQDQPSARIMVIECDRLKPNRFVHVAYHGEDHYDSVHSLRDPTDPDALPIPIELDCDGFRPEDFAKRWQTQGLPSDDDQPEQQSQRVVPKSSLASVNGEVDGFATRLGEQLQVMGPGAKEVDVENQRINASENGGAYTPKVEYGSPRPDPKERDASWTSKEQVEIHYAAIGWSVVQISKDGNCLFRAISDQLYTNELFHHDIRQRLVDFIEKEQQLFKPFVENEEVSDYCTRMREDGEWGGHLELYAAAKLFNIHIMVHTGPVRRLRVENNADEDAAKQNTPPPPPYRVLHLLYKDDHYSSLHSKQENPEVTVLATTDSTDKRARSPTKTVDSPQKKCVKFQEPGQEILDGDKDNESDKDGVDEKVMSCVEEEVPQCGVILPRQALFHHGKRRVSGENLFLMVHLPSARNLLAIPESPSTTSSKSSSSSEEKDKQPESSTFVRTRPKAPTVRAVPVSYPSKTVFHKGRPVASCC
ncbi:hypothetical protein BBP00_00004587 [Phytophthora kernoviae]|uniref:OTU domain-containing protein 1 n=1 Tax=Phytophthora kernoviae TaxID=325452 RepID=A0A3F2RRC9_9STRA|nr:hypothetical protein BBP00_00004587 [Phytophthora kernoviae]